MNTFDLLLYKLQRGPIEYSQMGANDAVKEIASEMNRIHNILLVLSEENLTFEGKVDYYKIIKSYTDGYEKLAMSLLVCCDGRWYEENIRNT